MSGGSPNIESTEITEDAILNLDYSEEVEFVIRINHGKSFKALIDSIKIINSNGVFIFNNQGFKFSEYNQEYKVLTKFEIYADKLNTVGCPPGYEFKGNMEEYIIKLNIKLLKDNLTQITAKDGILIYKNKAESMLYFQKISSKYQENASAAVCCMVIPKIKEIDITDAPLYKLNENEPIFIINTEQLKSDLNPMIKAKPEKVKLEADDNTIQFKGNNAEQSQMAFAQFKSHKKCVVIPGLESLGIQINDKISISTNIDFKILKVLNKLDGFSADKKLNIFLQNGNPVKLITKIGNCKDNKCYGVFKLYIISEE